MLKLTEMFDNQGTAPANLIASMGSTQDGFGRTLTSVDSRTGTTTMGTILENDSYLSVTDPGGRSTTFTYDVMGRSIATVLPDTAFTQTSYTPRGDVEARLGSQTYTTLLQQHRMNWAAIHTIIGCWMRRKACGMNCNPVVIFP